MSEQSYAILDTNNIVVNLVVLDLDANPDWTPGDGLTLHTTPGEGAIGQVWDGSKFNDPVPPAPTADDVDVERDRRRALPLSVTLSVGTFQINMDPVSQTNIQGLSTVGLYLTSLNSTQTTPFRDYTNVSHDLSPSDLVSMGLQVAAHVQTLYTASWAIKSKNPIPTDFTNDSYWS